MQKWILCLIFGECFECGPNMETKSRVVTVEVFESLEIAYHQKVLSEFWAPLWKVKRVCKCEKVLGGMKCHHNLLLAGILSKELEVYSLL